VVWLIGVQGTGDLQDHEQEENNMPLGIEKTKEQIEDEIKAEKARAEAALAKLEGSELRAERAKADAALGQLERAAKKSEMEAKKADKLKFEKEKAAKQADKATKQADRALAKAEAKGVALERYLEEGRKKHPAPSGTERALSMLIPPLAMGTGRKSRAAAAEEAVRRKSFENEWERLQDRLEKAKDAKVGRAASTTINATDRTNMAAVQSLRAELGDDLPPNWATFPGGLTGDSQSYGPQLTNLQMQLFPVRGKKGHVTPANPIASMTVATLKNRLDTYKKARTDNRERWKKAGAANMRLDGSFPQAFVDSLERESPDAPRWAVIGTLDPKAKPRAEAYGHYEANHVAVEGLAFSISKLLGNTPEEAAVARDSLLEGLPDKGRWTHPDGVAFLKEAQKQLSRYFQNTGGPFLRDAANEGKIIELNERRKKIADKLEAPGLKGEELRKLQEELIANRRERAKLDREMYLTDPEEVKAANEAWAAAKGDRLTQANLLRNRASSDIDKSREYITDELWDKNGGDKAFLETVILGKDKKVVKFNAEKHKDQEAYAFPRIKLGKRNAAMATRSEEIVTAWDASGKPLTVMRETVSALEPGVIGKKPLRMLTERDVGDIKAITKGIVKLDAGVDVNISGRLIGDARQEVLEWMGTPRGQAVLNADPSNFKLFLRGFTPKEGDLDALGGKGGVDAGLEVWEDIKDLEELKRMLNRIEEGFDEAGFDDTARLMQEAAAGRDGEQLRAILGKATPEEREEIRNAQGGNAKTAVIRKIMERLKGLGE